MCDSSVVFCSRQQTELSILHSSPISLTKETTILYLKKECRAKLKRIIANGNNYTDLKICKLCHKIMYNDCLKLILIDPLFTA